MVKPLILAGLVATLVTAFAATPFAAATRGHEPGVQIAQSDLIEGEVRKVDMSAGKITIRHGPIPKYDMANPMTMVFPTSNAAMLTGLTAGDKVLFDVIKEGGSLTITSIRKAN